MSNRALSPVVATVHLIVVTLVLAERSERWRWSRRRFESRRKSSSTSRPTRTPTA
ncbi:archaellin/type IV pilin N-terminal domain-containing protein [Haladaptatus halobius]|uniref:archaellin/type IV pilin N-terminal domain-containing protein n=1 Tax=Haladaptatus halobius TaxID=2884875 RepID=UPI001D0A339F|nr:archaellin/type IV pilin N-terminal domain-containing protein [Haladaptatus halobius]